MALPDYTTMTASEYKAAIDAAIAGLSDKSSFFVNLDGSPHTIDGGKVPFDTEVFDTNSDYDSTTNYRFTPTVAGKYNISVQTSIQSFNIGDFATLYLRKNGTSVLITSLTTLGTTGISMQLNGIIDMDGSTDYLEVFQQCTSSGTPTIVGTGNVSWFSGHLI